MKLKSQDIVIALKVISISDDAEWTQHQLAYELCMSSSEINTGLKRLQQAKLFTQPREPNVSALEEFIIHGIKYVFVPDVGEMTRGIPTSYGAPVLASHLSTQEKLVPVWPHSEGDTLGFAFSPLFKKVPESIIKHGSQKFYDLLALVDAIRYGQAREQKIAKELISKILREK